MAEGSSIPPVPALAEPEPDLDGGRFRMLAESLSDVIVRADMDGMLLYVSPACRAWGYEPWELIGRASTDLVHPDDLERFNANTAQVFNGPVVDRGLDRAIRYRCKNGDYVWLEGNPQLIRDENGRPMELVNALRDVSDRRRVLQVEAERTRFEALAKTVAGVGYWHLDAKTGENSWSDQMFAIYGLAPGGTPEVAQAMAVLHPDDRTDSYRRLRLGFETGAGWTNALTRVIRPGGEIRYVEGRGIAERDDQGAVVALFGTAVDITERKRAELSALEAEARSRAETELFENAFNHAPIGMALVGLDGRFLRINTAFCDLVGHPEATMLGLDFQSITHPDDLDADLDLLARLTRGEIPSYQLEKRYRRADGALVWVRLSVSMVLDAAGAPKHYIAQVQDRTASRQAQQALALSEQRFRRLADNAPDMVSESKLDGTLTYVSPASVAITGFSPKELVGRNFTTVMHPEDAKTVLAMCRTVFESRGTIAPWPVEFRATHKDGSPIWLECKPTLATDPLTGRFVGLNDVVRDITARKALEADLRLARAEAEAAAAVKGEFLANMSHEIRTPLTAILGFAGLLAERDQMDDIGRGHLERVMTAGRSLLSIVNDVLDFSKLEAGKIEFAPRPVPLVDTAHDIMLMFAPQAEAKGLALDFIAEGDLPGHVSLDPDRLRQILFNLIGNAIKFTAEGGVRLRLAYAPALERVSVAVEDTGPGIGDADREKLFQRFAQVDGSTTRRHGGTGLGLAICHGLAEAMGGRISLETQLGLGSTFRVELPAPLAEAPPEVGEAGEEASLDGVRVLVVDDNPVNRELARVILEHVGAEVTVAADGESAVGLVFGLPFDVILLDRRMPGMDGSETLRQIRAEPGPNDGIPVLAFSADTDLAGLMGPGGFDDVVGKPIDAQALIETLLKWTAWAAPAPQPEAQDADLV